MKLENIYTWYITDVSYGSNSEGHWEARCTHCSETVIKGKRRPEQSEATVRMEALEVVHWCPLKVER